MAKDNSFVFYETWQRMIDRKLRAGKNEEALELYKAISNYGLYGLAPEDDSAVWDMGFEAIVSGIDNAKERYNKCKENGAKGGRKKKDVDWEKYKELKSKGISEENIAKELDVSVSTINRRKKEMSAETTPSPITSNLETYRNSDGLYF